MGERNYNYIFSKLVESPDDLLGLLAYGLYKQQKIEHIKLYKDKHDGAGPTDDELVHFHELSSSPIQIENYKQIAGNKLNMVMDQLMADNIDKFRQAAADGQRDAIAELKPTIKNYVISGIVGNISFIVAMGVIFAFVYLVNNDYPAQIMGWLKKLFGFTI
ncbi:MAG: hypothetical protein K1W05_10585 [Desulfovibrio sp.]|jgi:hypothetical protein